MKSNLPDCPVPEAAWQAGHALDGRVFAVTGTIKEGGSVLDTTNLLFKDGGFRSSRCQTYCAFGFQSHQTWTEGEITHFTATTTCPDAPHTVIW